MDAYVYIYIAHIYMDVYMTRVTIFMYDYRRRAALCFSQSATILILLRRPSTDVTQLITRTTCAKGQAGEQKRMEGESAFFLEVLYLRNRRSRTPSASRH